MSDHNTLVSLTSAAVIATLATAKAKTLDENGSWKKLWSALGALRLPRTSVAARLQDALEEAAPYSNLSKNEKDAIKKAIARCPGIKTDGPILFFPAQQGHAREWSIIPGTAKKVRDPMSQLLDKIEKLESINDLNRVLATASERRSELIDAAQQIEAFLRERDEENQAAAADAAAAAS